MLLAGSTFFRLSLLPAVAVALFWAVGANAVNQLYTGQWVAESFGNDKVESTMTTLPLASQHWSVFAMPQGVQCNPYNPICKFASTPVQTKAYTSMTANGAISTLIPCYPVSNYATARPAKGATAATANGARALPLYRNPAFFTTSGAPATTSCTAYTRTTFTSNGATGSPGYETILSYAAPFDSSARGYVALGKPVSGVGMANATAFGAGKAFTIPAASANASGNHQGMHRTTQGEFNNIFPYIYSYTYATFRNQAGSFAAGGGPGAFSLPYKKGGATVAKVAVKAGPNQFGGVMKLLGKLHTKVCYYRNGGCSLGGIDWRYDAIGAAAFTSGGVVTAGYTATYSAYYYHTALKTHELVLGKGERFPWTTGTATVTATGRGPHKTLEQRKGFDNRTAGGSGTIQLVSPVLTHWLQPSANFDTGGIGVLRFSFAPEPRAWLALASGLAVLAVLYRARRH